MYSVLQRYTNVVRKVIATCSTVKHLCIVVTLGHSQLAAIQRWLDYIVYFQQGILFGTLFCVTSSLTNQIGELQSDIYIGLLEY